MSPPACQERVRGGQSRHLGPVLVIHILDIGCIEVSDIMKMSGAAGHCCIRKISPWLLRLWRPLGLPWLSTACFLGYAFPNHMCSTYIMPHLNQASEARFAAKFPKTRGEARTRRGRPRRSLGRWPLTPFSFPDYSSVPRHLQKSAEQHICIRTFKSLQFNTIGIDLVVLDGKYNRAKSMRLDTRILNKQNHHITPRN